MIASHVHALREGDDAAKMAAARALSTLAEETVNGVLIAEAGATPLLVELLRDGSADAKKQAARALGGLAYADSSGVLIAEAHGIPPLIALLRDGNADDAKLIAAWALGWIAYNDDNKVLIAEVGGIPPLVELWRGVSTMNAKQWAASALQNLARNNDANQVAIAAAVGLDALVELARRDRVIFEGFTLFFNAGGPAKRKAALVVAALLGDCVPDSVPRVIMAVIGSYL